MSDIKTVWVRDFSQGDWSIQNGILQQGNDLETAILISVFTDRRANDDDIIPDGTTNKRGWIGDDSEDYPIGSRLWLLSREKQTQSVLSRAQDYLAEALQWLIDDLIVAGFELLVEFVRVGFLGVTIIAHKTDGSVISQQFEWAWSDIS